VVDADAMLGALGEDLRPYVCGTQGLAWQEPYKGDLCTRFPLADM
jgi:hypothetical protein